MYFPFLELPGWVKRSGGQPQTIDSEFPIGNGTGFPDILLFFGCFCKSELAFSSH